MMATTQMAYALITVTETNRHRETIKGTVALEKFTDNRIISIYKGKVDLIYKVYRDSSCVLIYGEE